MPSSDRTAQRLEQALACFRAGNLTRARDLADRVLEREPDHLTALRLAGDVAEARGNADRALALFVRAAELDATHLPTLDAVARAAEQLGQYGLAEEALQRGIAAAPQDAGRYHRLGALYFAAGRADEAHGFLVLATQLDPTDPAAFDTLATTLVHLDRAEEAAAAYHRAIELAPDRARARVQVAYVLDQLGRSDEAQAQRELALELAPDDPVVAFHGASARPCSPGDERIAALERALEERRVAADERPIAHLALARMHDEAGDLAAAAGHARRGNAERAAALRRRGRHYRPRHQDALAEAIVAAAAPALARPASAPQPLGARPLLVAGLPRAGKSLLEQRLARHPAVVATGEAWHLAKVVEAVREVVGTPYPDGFAAMSADHADRLRDRLRDELAGAVGEALPGTGLVVTGTQAINAQIAGLVAALDRRTVLVACERDPRDLLLANYLQWFPSNQPHAFTVEGLVHRLRFEQRLIAAWEELLPGHVLRVRYEDLVAQPDAVVGRVLDGVGLDWHAACGTDSAPAVPTTSPVDKPDPALALHAAHVGMWERWAPHLPELFAAIDAAGLVDADTGRARAVGVGA